MNEVQWVEIVAGKLRSSFESQSELRFETQFRIPYGYEVKSFGLDNEIEINSYATDLTVIEDGPNQTYKPRVIVEGKLESITTHDAITYSQKASSHKSVCPYIRYGVLLGNRAHYPLPGRLYRHGGNFDFMISMQSLEPTDCEIDRLAKLIEDEIEASRTLEKIVYESRKKGRDSYTLLQKRLVLEKFDI